MATVLNCDLTNQSLLIPCGTTPVAGTDDLMVILDYNRIDRNLTFSTSRGNVVTAITRLFGGEGIMIQGRNNSNVGGATAEQTAFNLQRTHTISFQVFGNDPVQSYVIEKLGGTRVVCVWRSANGWYFISGWQTGLLVSTDNWDTSNEDNGGGSSIELIADRETNRPYFFADTYAEAENIDETLTLTWNEQNTKSAFDALVETPVTLAITGITAGAEPVITVASTNGMQSGDWVTIDGITWTTDPTDGTSTLNGNVFQVQKIAGGTTFRLKAAQDSATFNTTGGVWGSGGTVQKKFLTT